MLYWIIISICIAEFIYSSTIHFLNKKAAHLPIPKILSDIYDDDTYKKQQNYRQEHAHVSYITTCINSVIQISLFAFGGFALFDTWGQSVNSNPIVVAWIFFGLVFLCSWIPEFPFGLYSTFVIEEKYGFNRTTLKTYILDILKSLMLTIVIGGAFIAFFVWIYHLIPHYFWLLAWGTITVFSLFMTFFYSDLIVPLFNKQKPLETGELREAIETFATKVNFKLKDIYVIDGSKRSAHANAYFTGYGSRKRIVLYDTLMEQLNTEEIVGVLAHEIGHYKHGHIYQSIITASLTNLLMFYVFSLFMNNQNIAEAAGCTQPSFHINLMIFGLIYAPFSELLSIIDNFISRRNEWQADEYAKANGMGYAVSSALKKMSKRSLSNLTPHPFTVFVKYSHPTLKERIIHLE